MSEETLRLKLAAIKLPDQAKLTLKKKVADFRELEASSGFSPDGLAVYLADFGTGTEPLFLIHPTQEELPLGDISAFLERVKEPRLIWTDYSLMAFEKTPARVVVEKCYAQKEFDAGIVGEQIEAEFKFYRIKPPCLDELKRFDGAELKALVEEYICGGWDYDGKTIHWARSRALAFPKTTASKKYAPYRGHSLIIKNTKAGFSTLAEHIGKKIDHVGDKSLEGFADADGKITRSSLQCEGGSVCLDECRNLPPNLAAKLFSFLESGEFTTDKAGRQFKTESGAQITFTTNPPEVQIMEGALDLYGWEGVKAAEETLGKLADVPSALLSRLALFIFDLKLKQAAKKESGFTDEERGKINVLIRGLLDSMRGNFAVIYSENKNWLEKPLPDYNAQIDELLKTDASIIAQAWRGQKGAHRHLRGEALAQGCIEELPGLFLGEVGNAALLDVAEEKLAEVCDINLESLRNILKVNSAISSEEQIRLRLRCAPAVVKAAIIAICAGGRGKKPGEFVSIDEMRVALNALPTVEIVHMIGSNRYTNWSLIWQRLSGRAKKILDDFGFKEQPNGFQLSSYKDCLIEELEREGKEGKEGKKGKYISVNPLTQSLPNLPNTYPIYPLTYAPPPGSQPSKQEIRLISDFEGWKAGEVISANPVQIEELRKAGAQFEVVTL